MDYRTFQLQRREDWEAFAAGLAAAGRARREALAFEDLERLAALHRRVISDYAYARARFPGTAATRRLRQLAFAGHRLLATRHRPLGPRVVRFLLRGFPETFRACGASIAVAAGAFLLMTATGFVLTALHEEFAYLFLGPSAIEGLRRGTLWTDSLTSVMPPELLSGRILTNNISVAIAAWAGGALWGTFSAWILCVNGLLLGSVLAITLRYGLLGNLLAFIAAHGPLELTLIVVSAGAGLELARGLIVADVRPRRAVLREHARRSVRLVLGVAPWLAVLGFVEGFVSPRDDIDTGAKAALGAVLLAAFLAWALSAAARDAGAGAEGEMP
ncbi:MAG: stage II sporulation protein M [Acidobacteriota bacterium]